MTHPWEMWAAAVTLAAHVVLALAGRLAVGKGTGWDRWIRLGRQAVFILALGQAAILAAHR